MPITYVGSQQCFVYFLLSALNVITLRNRAHVHGARTTALVNLHMNYPKEKGGRSNLSLTTLTRNLRILSCRWSSSEINFQCRTWNWISVVNVGSLLPLQLGRLLSGGSLIALQAVLENGRCFLKSQAITSTFSWQSPPVSLTLLSGWSRNKGRDISCTSLQLSFYSQMLWKASSQLIFNVRNSCVPYMFMVLLASIRNW